MKTIWKFPIEIRDSQQVQMPAGAEILCVQVQNGEPCVWALCEPSLVGTALRCLEMRGTGHDASPVTREQYVGTFQIHGGRLVFHLFDLGEA